MSDQITAGRDHVEHLTLHRTSRNLSTRDLRGPRSTTVCEDGSMVGSAVTVNAGDMSIGDNQFADGDAAVHIHSQVFGGCERGHAQRSWINCLLSDVVR